MPLFARWIAFVFLVSPLAACSSSSPAGAGTTTPTAVSLRTDVLPIFQNNCATESTCHGSAGGIEVHLTGTDVHSLIVGVASTELTSMPYVTPGDADQSYLMHKVDGTQAAYTDQCVKGDCGDPMPKGETPLSAADRDVIRAWITQGALDN